MRDGNPGQLPRAPSPVRDRARAGNVRAVTTQQRALLESAGRMRRPGGVFPRTSFGGGAGR